MGWGGINCITLFGVRVLYISIIFYIYYASVTFIDPVKVNGGKRCVGVNLYLRHEIVLDFYCLLF